MALPKAVAAMILGQFLFAAALGPNGLVGWSAVQQQRVQRTAVVAGLEADRDRLANHIRLLNPVGADPDLVDELIRRDLGLARPDEIVISH